MTATARAVPVEAGTPDTAAAAPTAPSPARWVRFNIALSALSALAFLTVIGLNVLLDPWGVFGVIPMRDGQSMNQRFAKFQHLIEDPSRHDAFLVGSSRMGLFAIGDAERHWPSYSWYNLGVFSADAHDHLKLLQALTEAGVVVRKAIIGIDLYPFFASHTKDALAHRLPPAASGESRLKFWSRFLFAQSTLAGLLKVAQQIQELPDIEFDIEGSGSFALPLWDQQRDADLQAFLDRQVRSDATRNLDVPLREAAFDELGALADWLQAQGIEVDWFIHPHHHRDKQMSVAREVHDAIVARVRAITGPIANFLETELGHRDELFYDHKHYVTEVATLILQRLDSPAPEALLLSRPSARASGNPDGAQATRP